MIIDEFLEIVREKEATNRQLAEVLKWIKDLCNGYKAETELLRKRCFDLERRLESKPKRVGRPRKPKSNAKKEDSIPK